MKSKTKCLITKDELYNLYCIENKTTKEISVILNCCSSTIKKRLHEYEISIKTTSEYMKIKCPISKNELYNLYWKQNKTIKNISKLFNYSTPTIRKWLMEYNIEFKKQGTQLIKPSKKELYNLYHIKNISTYKIAKIFNTSNNTVGNWLKNYNISPIKGNKNKPTKDELYNLYINQNKTTYDLSEIFNCNNSTIGIWLHEYNIPINDMLGKNHPNWKGGISTEQDKERKTNDYIAWRKSIYKRDKWTCQDCGQINGDINAHHIIPWRDCKNTSLATNINNGITLCKKCHNKTLNKEYEMKDKYLKIIGMQ